MAFLLDVMDLRNILDLISSPCLLVNSETGKIETGNFLFSSLSGYSLDEIQNVALDSLLMGINLQSATDGGNSQSQLNRKLIEPLSVNLSFRFIGTTGNQILISLGDKGIRRNTDFEDILIQLVDVLREFPKIKRSEYIEQVINVLIQNKFSDDIAI
ncbi:MAG: hypothetical protein FJZ98_05700, partial [Chloroflexi bacterium]|nr:hypothetical protein [Chloroflexota bacterium]